MATAPPIPIGDDPIVLSDEGRAKFFAAIDNPPPPNEALKQLMATPSISTLRDRLAAMIVAQGGTQKQLAVAAGVSQQIISGILTGHRGFDLRAEGVARLARGLGLSATALGRLLYESFPPETFPDIIPECS